MSQSSNQELELLIKKIFIQSRKPPSSPTKIRVKNILDKSLHELALQDLVKLAGRMLHVIFSMLGTLPRLFSKRH